MTVNQLLQLKAVKHIRRGGVQKTFHPGDWIEIGKEGIGKQTAALWIAEGTAWMPHAPIGQQLDDVIGTDWGVVIRGNSKEYAEFEDHIPTKRLKVKHGGIELPFERTLLWMPTIPLPQSKLPIGFMRLDRGWQMAVPLLSYEKLAETIGGLKDQARTKRAIHDLRVLMYDTRLVFVRKCKDTVRLMKLWKAECQPGSDERLAFLRAVFAVNPIICAMPQSWIGVKK